MRQLTRRLEPKIIPKTPPNTQDPLRRLLWRPHLRTAPIRQKLGLRAPLHNSPELHPQNLVNVHHGKHVVRNHQHDLVLSRALSFGPNGMLKGQDDVDNRAQRGVIPGRARREAEESRRGRAEAVPALLHLRTSVTLSPREVVLVTYDADERRLVAVGGKP